MVPQVSCRDVRTACCLLCSKLVCLGEMHVVAFSTKEELSFDPRFTMMLCFPGSGNQNIVVLIGRLWPLLVVSSGEQYCTGCCYRLVFPFRERSES